MYCHCSPVATNLSTGILICKMEWFHICLISLNCCKCNCFFNMKKTMWNWSISFNRRYLETLLIFQLLQFEWCEPRLCEQVSVSPDWEVSGWIGTFLLYWNWRGMTQSHTFRLKSLLSFLTIGLLLLVMTKKFNKIVVVTTAVWITNIINLCTSIVIFLYVTLSFIWTRIIGALNLWHMAELPLIIIWSTKQLKCSRSAWNLNAVPKNCFQF